MSEPKFEKEFCTYSDWSNNETEPNAWKKVDISIHYSDDGMGLDIYLVRDTSKRNNMFISMGDDTAKRLYEFLKDKYGE